MSYLDETPIADRVDATTFLSFDVLMSYDSCMNYKRWEYPATITSTTSGPAAMEVVNDCISEGDYDVHHACGNGVPYRCQFCDLVPPSHYGEPVCGANRRRQLKQGYQGWLQGLAAVDVSEALFQSHTVHDIDEETNLYKSDVYYDVVMGEFDGGDVGFTRTVLDGMCWAMGTRTLETCSGNQHGDVQVWSGYISKQKAAVAMNFLCEFMNAVTRVATVDPLKGSIDRNSGEQTTDDDGFDLSTSIDFECCQCYLSVLPETGHTDDVQLGALGACCGVG